VPDGPRMRAKPTLLLLHGGPGFDHTLYKPALSTLVDIAQIIYLDHRGNGRSSGDDPKTWNLAQWGDDVKAFCNTLGIEKPIVYGASFGGGMVALAYATRHPGHPGKLILVSTEGAGHSHLEQRVALLERLGGPEVGALARRRFLEGKLDAEELETWVRLARKLARGGSAKRPEFCENHARSSVSLGSCKAAISPAKKSIFCANRRLMISSFLSSPRATASRKRTSSLTLCSTKSRI
jgi:pimeloyl-ACP methyl ester carboxylesterase